MRFQYRHPKLYDFLIGFLYSKRLLKAFRQEVGKGQSVFEVAAGYGRMARFIDPSNRYYGIDLNEIFVNYGRKNGVHLEVKDIFDPAAYKKSDVFVIVDLIHHLSFKKLKQLFDLIFSYTGKKVVIIEPAFVSLAKQYGIVGKFMGWIFKTIDYDGFNRIKGWFTDKEYHKLFQSRFGSNHGKEFAIRQQKLNGHHLVTLTLSTKSGS